MSGVPSVEAQYRRKTATSASFETEGRRAMPIVSSRSIAYHAPYPLLVERARGALMWDADGNEYVDLSSNMYVLAHGNAYQPITEAVTRKLQEGTVWSANNRSLVELAELLCQRLPSVEQVLFSNSGTEAFSMAWGIARAATGKHKFLMAEGGYHGTLHDTALGSRGLPGPNHHVARFGDADAFERMIQEHAAELCAVFVEPVLGAGGLATVSSDFLRRVKSACARHGVIFVLDEVVTFRLGEGGCQSQLGVAPDLTMLGKVIGGGFPIGAVGGARDLLQLADPGQPRVLVSGTFTGNPIATTAGAIAVRHLTAAKIEQMARWAGQIDSRLQDSARGAGVRLWTRRAGSMLSWFFHDPGDAAVLSAQRPDGEMLKRHHLALLNRGLFAIPRGAMTTSAAMDASIVDRVSEQLELSLLDISK